MYRLTVALITILYKRLIYWFFWASFVSMRDELFGSYSKPDFNDTKLVVNGVVPPIKVTTISTCELLLTMCNTFNRCITEFIESIMAQNLANLRALMEIAKESPTRHRLRIALYSG